MPYRLIAGEPVNDALIRIAREQLGKAVDEIDDSNLSHHDTVHQLRKRCKKLRALLRTVRPALRDVYAEENARLRDAARELSFVRDAQVLVETLADLAGFYAESLAPDFAEALHASLVRRRDAVLDTEVDLERRLAQVRVALRSAHARAGSWRLAEDGFAAVAGGLRKTYKRGRRAMTAAYRDPHSERFHEWRKRAKYLAHQQRLLRPLWPAVLRQQCRTASKLGDLLGKEHDLAVLHDTLVTESASGPACREIQALVALAAQRRRMLREQARPLGTRLFAERPDAMVDRLRNYWLAWQFEQAARCEVAAQLT